MVSENGLLLDLQAHSVSPMTFGFIVFTVDFQCHCGLLVLKATARTQGGGDVRK